ncbi:MAG: hypothetical protein H7061_07965 [Bdellovibrionaceae bacterium]|nr:hypothetical protein [Bdellovibrio sp.]
MSKNQQVVPKKPNAPVISEVLNKQPTKAPAIRDVQAITAYKDLTVREKPLPPNTHLVVAFSLFAILGLGMFLGSNLSKPRGVASTMGGLVAIGEPTQVEHYHYDKTCYKGEDGEQICTTRTSKKSN